MAVYRCILRIGIGLVVLVGLVLLVARRHDGPLGPFPGGPLTSGTIVEEPVTDWSFAASIPEIELQLDSQPTSRTVWVMVKDGRAFVPASTSFPPGKIWHQKAVEDGRATLRIDGKRYPVMLTRTVDPAVGDAVRAIVTEKYERVPGGEAWLFEVASRPR